MSTFLRFIPIITTILLWRAIYDGAGRTEIGGLPYRRMVAYYLFVMITRALGSMPRLSTDIAGDIRDGELRKYLLQPIDYLTYSITLRAAHKLVYFAMAAIPYSLVFWLCRDYLPGWPTGWALVLSIVTLILAFLLGFAINSLFGLLGFWFLEVASFVHVFMTAQYFLGGHMFPLSLLPDGLQGIVSLLPFAYETYYPTLVLLQQLGTDETIRVILVQIAWILVLMGAGRLAWWRGLRRYAAFGG
ncbi:MAG: ABC-2 family transporter protein [Planctomycetes bacterium]|nr:ABC-2 family transporter protein [Planctomycetota bacterium]